MTFSCLRAAWVAASLVLLVPLGSIAGSVLQRKADLIPAFITGSLPKSSLGELSPALPGISPRVTPSHVISDTTLEWQQDHWQATSRTFHRYNNANSELLVLGESFDGASWVNASQTSKVYDLNSHLTSSTLSNWTSNAWGLQTLITYAYYLDGTLGRFVEQVRSGGAWVNLARTTMIYTNGRVANTTFESWSNNKWTNVQLNSYTYDANGDLLQTLIQVWENNAWVNQGRITSTYDPNGNELTYLLESWSGTDWTNVALSNRVYNPAGQKILDSAFTWSGTDWTVSTLDSLTYTGLRLSQDVTIHFGLGSNLRNNYAYDNGGNLDDHVIQAFDSSAQQWTNTARAVAVWGDSRISNCCVGKRGNVDYQGSIDLHDLSAFVSHLIGGGYVIQCPDAADIDGLNGVDLADLSSLVSFLTSSSLTLPNCP